MAHKKEKPNAGFDHWMRALVDHRLVPPRLAEEMLRKNDDKETEMRVRRLPQLAHYGFFSSTDEMRSRLSNLANPHLIVRAQSVAGAGIRRLIGTDLETACKFVDDLPGGVSVWRVEVKEFVETTVASGTIIVSPSGGLLIETWWGPHINGQDSLTRLCGTFDRNGWGAGRISICWTVSGPGRKPQVTNLDELKHFALRALRYHCLHLKPKENDPIYLDYGVREDGRIYFLDVSDSPLLTTLW